jgi:signal transduction histidine kinase/Tfp pilus assembly protein PilF
MNRVRSRWIHSLLQVVVGLLLLAAVPTATPAQSPLDSLERVLPTLTGDARMNLAGELAYQFCYLNTEKALHYGHIELDLALKKGDSLAVAQAWSDLGAVHWSRGEFQESVQYSLAALRVREQSGDSLLVANSAMKVGVALLDMGKHDEALDAFLRSTRIYEQAHENRWLPNAYNNIGSVHLRQGNDAKAMEYLEKAAEMAVTVGDPSARIAAKTNMVGIHFENDNYEIARKGYEELVLLIEETGVTQSLGIVRMNLGASCVRMGDFASGMHSLLIADSIFTARADAKGRLMALVNLGLAHLGLQDYAATRDRLEEAQTYCKQVGSDLQWHLLYDAYYRLESALGNVSEAMRYQTLARHYREKIYNDKAVAQIAEMETKYETEKKEQALQNAQLRNRNQLLVIAGLAGLLVLGIVVVAFIVRTQRLRRQSLVQQAVITLQEERLRISRDLHDNLGAELTLIAGAADVATVADGTTLHTIKGYARNAMSQLRETVWAIRSESVAVETFAMRLRDFATPLCASANMAATVTVVGDGDKALSPLATLQLFRLCQEAIHNAVKHSASPTLDVRLNVEPQLLTVTISDQGKGFDGQQRPGGYGLDNMRARAAEIGGTATVTSMPGQGTVVKVSLPC